MSYKDTRLQKRASKNNSTMYSGKKNRKDSKPQKSLVRKAKVLKRTVKTNGINVRLPKTPAEAPVNDRINDLFDLHKIKTAIADQYGSIYAYCNAFQILEPEMSRFLNKKVPVTIKNVMKHCDNLGLYITITMIKG